MSFKSYVAPLVTTSKPLTAVQVAATGTITEGIPAGFQLTLTPERPEPRPEFNVTSSAADVAIGGVGHGGVLNVLGLKPGTANITITDGTNSAVIAITVEKRPDPVKVVFPAVRAIPATGLAITLAAKRITVIQQFDLSAIVTPYDFNVDSVSWHSSDESVAKVADISFVDYRTGIYRTGHTATVRGMKAGTATITATIGVFSANCVVTVV